MKVAFDKEIQNRKDILRQLSAQTNSLKMRLEEVERNIARLLLLSKDIENLQACVNRSDEFFKEEAHQLGLEYQKFENVHKGMSTNEIELILKKNELLILNQLVFIHGGQDVQLFAVGEEIN